MIIYVVFNFPADYVLDTYGSRPGVNIIDYLGVIWKLIHNNWSWAEVTY